MTVIYVLLNADSEFIGWFKELSPTLTGYEFVHIHDLPMINNKIYVVSNLDDMITCVTTNKEEALDKLKELEIDENELSFYEYNEGFTYKYTVIRDLKPGTEEDMIKLKEFEELESGINMFINDDQCDDNHDELLDDNHDELLDDNNDDNCDVIKNNVNNVNCVNCVNNVDNVDNVNNVDNVDNVDNVNIINVDNNMNDSLIEDYVVI